MLEEQFWLKKSLAQMNEQEWEALCDGCGRCCLAKLIDDDTDELYFTNVACVLLNNRTCQCSNYEFRFSKVPDCEKISLDNEEAFNWLPPSCAYKRLDKGLPLPSWHPLLNKGKKSKMHQLGISVRNKVICESQVNGELQDYIVMWPLEEIE